jgi:hypothetical protein
LDYIPSEAGVRALVGTATWLCFVYTALACAFFIFVVMVVEGDMRLAWDESWPGYLCISVGVVWVGRHWFNLPPSGHATVGLALAAAIMALRPKMKGWERIMWIVLLVLLAGIETRAITNDRQQSDSKVTTILTRLEKVIAQGETNNENSTAILHKEELIDAKVESIDSDVRGRNALITATRNNSQLTETQRQEKVAQLQNGNEQLEKQKEQLEKQREAISAASDIAKRLDAWKDHRKGQLIDIEERSDWEEKRYEQMHPKATSDDIEKIASDWRRKRDDVISRSDAEMEQLAKDGNAVRAQLLAMIPQQLQTDEDRRRERTFVQAGGYGDDAALAASYLRRLAERVPTPK